MGISQMKIRSSFTALIVVISVHTTLSASIFELMPVESLLSSQHHEDMHCGDTCGKTTCDNSQCREIPAPLMIGDSLGVPLGIFSGGEILYYSNYYAKVADNNSAIPQDRVFFNYHFYNDVDKHKHIGGRHGDIGGDGHIDLSIYEVGFEKTFLNGNVSLDLIIPFSHSMSRDFRQEGLSVPGAKTQLEDLAFGLKALLLSDEDSAVSAGLRVEAPTGDDYRNLDPLRIYDNDAWAITPYLASLYYFSDDLFLQNFISYRFQLSNNSARQLEGGMYMMEAHSEFQEPDVFGIDSQLGYWMYRNHGGRGITGIMTSLELHYAATFEPYKPNGFSPPLLANYGGEHDILNLTAGITTLINDRSTITTAFVAPIRNGSDQRIEDPGYITPYPSDRFFDWEFLVQFNLFLN